MNLHSKLKTRQVLITIQKKEYKAQTFKTTLKLPLR